MGMDDFSIRLNNINKSYGEVQILKDLSFEVSPGDFISIMGPSGCGKSTLMNILGLMDKFEGEYYLNGEIVRPKDFAIVRNKYIGMVFQLYYLIPSMSVKDNIELPMIYSTINKNKSKRYFKELVEKMNIEHLINKDINNLSGGEKQRVAIARAMIMQPYILIADEPTGALDEKNAKEVINCLGDYAKTGHGVVMVTHDKNVSKYANKKLVMDKGNLYEYE